MSEMEEAFRIGELVIEKCLLDPSSPMKKGGIPPMYVLVGKGKYKVVMCSWRDLQGEESISKLKEGLIALIGRFGIKSVCFISEGSFVGVKGKSIDISTLPELPQSVLLAATDGTEAENRAFSIVRDESNGNITRLIRDDQPASEIRSESNDVISSVLEGLITK